jgi:hypothetical protein
LNEAVSNSSSYSDFETLSISSSNVSQNKSDRIALNLSNNLICDDESRTLRGAQDLFGNIDASKDYSPIHNFDSSSALDYNEEA